jgi:hypothetical protein
VSFLPSGQKKPAYSTFADFSATTFAGCDIICSITVPMLTNFQSKSLPNNLNNAYQLTPVTIASLQTVSVSTHRDKFPVRSFGSVNPRGFTRGGRTIAGSLIFTMFDRESLSEVSDRVRKFYQTAHGLYATSQGNPSLPNLVPKLLVDELPPFDITITMANEYGRFATAKIIGVEIVTNGMVAGIDDLFLEEQMSYVAHNFIPVAPGNPATIASGATRLP